MAVTEAMARGLVRHRRVVIAALLGAAAVGAWHAASLGARFDPEELVVVDDSCRADRARLRATFGQSPDPVVVLVRAPEPGAVLTDPSLRAMHRLARALGDLEGVARVEGLTTSRLPMESAAVRATLDELEDPPTELEDQVRSVVLAEPDLFPAGLMSLAAPVTLRAIGDDAPLEDDQAGEVRHLVASVPLVRGRLVSEDGDVAVLVVVPRADMSDEALASLVEGVHRLCAEHAFAGHRLHVTGLPAMRLEMVEALHADQGQLVALAMLGTIVVLALGMRSAAGVLLPLGAVGIAVALTLGAMAWAGRSLNLLTNMLPPLLLTIGLAEAVHMVLRHRDEVAAGRDAEGAAVAAVRLMWLPSFVTTLTTSIGFAALLLTESAALRELGGIAACATMVIYLVTVVFVPAALPSFGVQAPRGELGLGAERLERALLAITDATSGAPGRTIVAGAVIGLVAALLSRGVEVESRLMDQFARGSEIAGSAAILESELDGFRTAEIAVFSSPGTFRSVRGVALLEEIAALAGGDEQILRASQASALMREALAQLSGDARARQAPMRSDQEVDALLTLVRSADPRPVGELVTADGSAARIELRLRDGGALRTLASLEALRESTESAARARGITADVVVGGEAYVASRGLERIVRALGGLGAAVVTIFVVMALLFRSVRLGLLAIPPNALPLLTTLAYMAMRGIALHAATVIVFTVTVGLAVDGTTHVVSRFREELEAAGELPDRAALIRRTVRGSGRAVLLSSVTLCVGYAVLLTSRFEPVRLFGELSLVAIAGSILSQTVLLPAMLVRWGVPSARRLRAPGADQMEMRPSSEDVNAASSGK